MTKTTNRATTRVTKTVLSLALATIMLIGSLYGFATPTEVQAAGVITVTVDGRRVNFTDQQPVIIDGRTLVPVRGVFEELGFNVQWQAPSNAVFIERGHPLSSISPIWDSIFIVIGESSFIFTGRTSQGNEHISLDVPAQLINDRTMLPIRALVESLGYTADWDANTRTVIIETGNTTGADVIAPQEPPVTTQPPDNNNNATNNTGNNSGRLTNDFSHLPMVQGIPSQEILQQWVDAWPGLTEFEQEQLDIINDARRDNGLPALQVCPALSALAWYRISYLEHNGFVIGGTQGSAHMFGSHYTRYVSRQAANMQGTLVSCSYRGFTWGAAQGWLASGSGHRNRILTEELKHVGIAAAMSGTVPMVYAFYGVR